MEKKIIYLDHAATTYTDPEVLAAMKPYFTDKYFNPSSSYSPARDCAKAVFESRKTVAEILNAEEPEEIIFTSGGTESDNLAIFGIAVANQDRGRHIITSAVEHHAVLHAVEAMEKLGFDYTIVPVDKFGMIDLDQLEKSIRDDTVLISVMYANNEVGTVQPIEKIGEMARERGIYFHADAVQAVGSLPLDVKKLNVDALSISGHKFYGPKGVGALYLKKGVKIEPHMKGGSQEFGKRSGTHNTPGIVGLAHAMKIAVARSQEHNAKITMLRDKLLKSVLDNIPDTLYNGHPEKRLPNNLNFCFKYVDSEAILIHLDMLGICASAGSACAAGSEDPSHVLKAMGIPPEVARGSVRFTLGKDTTEDEIDFVSRHLIEILEKIRKMSPMVPG